MPKFRCVAMDDISTDAFERTRPVRGLKPYVVTAADEEDALELAIDYFGSHPRDFIKVEPVK